ncbi:SDR family NAD(P)-dependent oxidoreductase [Thiomicrorhabdus cannonii]|uniref:SDR family NAD(P)-dependent oxidoreductase n=1 Tax=Thiomicrorhabdus cannonii TaxID=2748011 RepID=UPI0015BD4C34|nr:SDR family NAD(P)-dependent oxidoreductase [Thiomicrorhabdus cannonii]
MSHSPLPSHSLDASRKTPILWLVGASEGIGLALTEIALRHGWRVIASARQAEQNPTLQAWQKTFQPRLTLLNLDVTDSAQCRHAAERARNTYGKIDIWFYNVASYRPMNLAESNVADYEQMNQTNYLGAVRLLHALLPNSAPHAAQRPVKWVWNISLASYFGLPYGGAYSAPKAALLNLAEALAPELATQGIHLQVINHGFVKTRLTAQNDFAMPGLMTPQAAAQRIFDAMQSSDAFEVRFPLALGLWLRLLRCLPKNWSLKLSAKLLKKGEKP